MYIYIYINKAVTDWLVYLFIIYIYIYIYIEVYSINKENFAPKICPRFLPEFFLKVLFITVYFSRKSILFDPLISQKNINKTFLNNSCVWNFFLPEIHYVFTTQTVLSSQARSGKPKFSPFVKNF